MKFALIKATATGALGGLLFGFDTAVIAGTTASLQAHYGLSEAQKGFTVAIALYGTVAGALFSGALGQRIGSRAALRWLGILYVISAVGCTFAGAWWTLLAARLIGGIAIGGTSVLGPVYIAELAPAKWRGRMVGMFQTNVVIGILLAYLSNAIVARFVTDPTLWRWEFSVSALPALLFLIMLFTVPQSSRWLVSKNRLDEATRILIDLGSQDSDAEISAMQTALIADGGQNNQRLFQRRYSLLIALAVTIGMFNQLSGINAILYYLNDIFRSAGFSSVSADVQAVFIGLANLLATFLGISLIDRLGRKTLLLIGAAGTTACLAAVAWVFSSHSHQTLLLPLLVAFIIFFAISQGAVIWVYLSEVFPTNVRAKGQSLGSSAHWIMNALIANLFPIVAVRSQALPFAFFAGMMALQFVVVALLYPETKGVTLEAMGRHVGLHG